MTSDTLTSAVTDLYQRLLAAWNRRDARGMAALFAADGHAIGFDGTEMHGPKPIASTLEQVFASHQTAAYVAIVRDVQPVAADAAILIAHVGMVPPGAARINSAVNAVQTMVAARGGDGGWLIQLLQNTPAAYHGRPDDAARLTEELQARAERRA